MEFSGGSGSGSGAKVAYADPTEAMQRAIVAAVKAGKSEEGGQALTRCRVCKCVRMMMCSYLQLCIHVLVCV